MLRQRLLALTAVEKLRAKQASRFTAIQAAEANAKLFYLQANGRRRKNYISSIQTDVGISFAHDDKAAKLFEHFSGHFGTPPPRDFSLNWEQLGINRHDLSSLEEAFTEEEIKAVIVEIAAEKAPGPDGYIWHLLQEKLGDYKE